MLSKAARRQPSTAARHIPRPLPRSGSAILMEYLGNRQGSAPSLQNAELSREDARPVLEHLLSNIELCLANNYLHADLSASNVLSWQRQARIIDFPQSIG